MNITSKPFGNTSAGEATLYRMEAGRYAAEVTDYGGTLVSYEIQGEDGQWMDILLGYDDASGYEKGKAFFGAIVGRNANRIRGAQFPLGDQIVTLSANEGANNLHSGPGCFHTRLLQTQLGELSLPGTDSAISFRLESPDGDQGFPGNMMLRITYLLESDGRLHIQFDATSDQDTVCNVTNHAYFNLNGQGKGNILNHHLQIEADAITEIDDACIPTGEVLPVVGTPFDFRRPRAIGLGIGDTSNPQISKGNGYDHNFILGGDPALTGDSALTGDPAGDAPLESRAPLAPCAPCAALEPCAFLEREKTDNPRRVATAYSPASRLALDVWTDLPGLQFYSGNFINEPDGKSGNHYGVHAGFALESQFVPNSVNLAGCAKPILRAGQSYHTETILQLYQK